MKPPIDPRPGEHRPVVSDEAADVLARVYTLILSWPAAEDGQKQEYREGEA